MRLLHADAVVRGDEPLLVDGAVLVDDAGQIVDVGAASEVRRRACGLVAERVPGVLVPGLVNAHTHVELSALAGRVVGGQGFLPWVDELVAARAALSEQEAALSMRRAARSLDAAGTAAVGEVTNTLGAVSALAEVGLAGAVFHEVFGVDKATTTERVRSLRRQRDALRAEWPSRDLAYAPSAHTLYTTHPDAVREWVQFARDEMVPTSVHLLEHEGERQALETGAGPVPTWLARRVPTAEAFVWPRVPVLEYAASLGLLASGTLLVHMTMATRPELDRVAAAGAEVVLCPRSNGLLTGARPPVEAMLAAGIAPALGTDSLASSPSLDVVEEARALRVAHPALSATLLLTMLTWNGARALARPDLGRVSKGARPGLFAVPSSGATTSDQFAERVLAASVDERRWVVRRSAARSPAAPLERSA